jgi:hypothetical protein
MDIVTQLMYLIGDIFALAVPYELWDVVSLADLKQ